MSSPSTPGHNALNTAIEQMIYDEMVKVMQYGVEAAYPDDASRSICIAMILSQFEAKSIALRSVDVGLTSDMQQTIKDTIHEMAMIEARAFSALLTKAPQA